MLKEELQPGVRVRYKRIAHRNYFDPAIYPVPHTEASMISRLLTSEVRTGWTSCELPDWRTGHVAYARMMQPRVIRRFSNMNRCLSFPDKGKPATCVVTVARGLYRRTDIVLLEDLVLDPGPLTPRGRELGNVF